MDTGHACFWDDVPAYNESLREWSRLYEASGTAFSLTIVSTS